MTMEMRILSNRIKVKVEVEVEVKVTVRMIVRTSK